MSDDATPAKVRLTDGLGPLVECGWRYVPSEVWGDQVLTQDPKAAQLAREYGRDVQPLYALTPEDVAAVNKARKEAAWKAAQRLEASTLAGYSSAIRFWRGAAADKRMTPLGSIGLKALTHTHILTALASRPDLSGKTINNYVSVLHEALQLAVRERVLEENPAANVPRAKMQKEPPDPFTRAEVDAIVADALAHYPEPVGNLIEWWAFSGVRTSEAQGLRWPSVDLASDYVQVHEAIVRGVSKSTTKTAVSRNVILNSRAKAAILRQAKHTRMAGEHVWLDPRYGTPWLEERAFRRSYWTPTLKRLGIRYRRPYCLRHTYATMMLMAGMKPAFCAKQLGHSIEMFHRTYARWIDGERDAMEMERLEATIGNSKEMTWADK